MAQSAWHRVHGTECVAQARPGAAWRCAARPCQQLNESLVETPHSPPAPPGSLARPGITDCCFLAARQGQAMLWGASRWLELPQQPGAQRGRAAASPRHRRAHGHRARCVLPLPTRRRAPCLRPEGTRAERSRSRAPRLRGLRGGRGAGAGHGCPLLEPLCRPRQPPPRTLARVPSGPGRRAVPGHPLGLLQAPPCPVPSEGTPGLAAPTQGACPDWGCGEGSNLLHGNGPPAADTVRFTLRHLLLPLWVRALSRLEEKRHRSIRDGRRGGRARPRRPRGLPAQTRATSLPQAGAPRTRSSRRPARPLGGLSSPGLPAAWPVPPQLPAELS